MTNPFLISAVVAIKIISSGAFPSFMATEDDKRIARLEARIPMYGGLELVLKKRIARLRSHEISIFDFKKIGRRYGLILEEAIYGVNLYIDGKMTPVSTPIYSSMFNRKKLAIMKWENERHVLYYTAPYIPIQHEP